MKALKALVIVMGVLIVVGTAVVIGTIYHRVSGRLAEAEQAPGAEATGAGAAFGAKGIALPVGAEVEEMAAGSGRLALRLRLKGGGRRILIVDLASGEVLGTLELEAAGEAAP